MKKYIFLIAGLFITKLFFAQIFFAPEQIINDNAQNASSVFVAELNGDNLLDVLSASSNDNKILWYENLSEGNFGNAQIISDSAMGAKTVFAIDLDNDTDNDVVFSAVDDDIVGWYKNDGSANFDTLRIIQKITTSYSNPSFVRAADLDNDEDNDVVYCTIYQNTVDWNENNLNQTDDFGQRQSIIDSADWATCVFPVDIDNDNDNDLLFVPHSKNSVDWLENDGNANFNNQHYIDSNLFKPQFTYYSDIDNDNDFDVILCLRDSICWYENTDGNGNFSSHNFITDQIYLGSSVFASDLDNDNDFDIISSSRGDNKIAFYENIDAKGNFGPQNIVSDSANGAAYVYAADLDNDGDNDLLSASHSDSKIAWYENKTLIITDNPQNKEVCENEQTFFKINAINADVFQWQFNDGSGFADISDNQVYSGATTDSLNISSASSDMNNYEFKCIITNNTSTYSKTSQIATLTVVDSVFADAGVDDQICDTNQYQLSANNVPSAITYWSVVGGGGAFENVTQYNTVVTDIGYGINTYSWNVTNICGTTYDYVEIQRNESIQISTQPESQEIIYGENAVFTVEATGDISNYQWFKNSDSLHNSTHINGVQTNTLTINNVNYDDQGNYTCLLSGTGACGDITTYTATLTVITAIDKFSDNIDLKIYPNPVNDIVKIYFDKDYKFNKIQIADINGRIITELEIAGFRNKKYIEIDFSEYENGVYLIKMENNGGITTKLLLKY